MSICPALPPSGQFLWSVCTQLPRLAAYGSLRETLVTHSWPEDALEIGSANDGTAGSSQRRRTPEKRLELLQRCRLCDNAASSFGHSELLATRRLQSLDVMVQNASIGVVRDTGRQLRLQVCEAIEKIVPTIASDFPIRRGSDSSPLPRRTSSLTSVLTVEHYGSATWRPSEFC